MIALWLVGWASAAEIWLSTAAPVQGEPVEITVDAPDAAGNLVVTYRPGSSVEATHTLVLDAAGSVRWIPAQPGLAVLAWQRGGATASRAVSVRYAAVPLRGVAVFLLASGLLFGGMGYAFRLLMRGDGVVPPVST